MCSVCNITSFYQICTKEFRLMSEDSHAIPFFVSTYLPPANEVWGKAMFLYVSVILFTGGSASIGVYRGGSASRGEGSAYKGVCLGGGSAYRGDLGGLVRGEGG